MQDGLIQSRVKSKNLVLRKKRSLQCLPDEFGELNIHSLIDPGAMSINSPGAELPKIWLLTQHTKTNEDQPPEFSTTVTKYN